LKECRANLAANRAQFYLEIAKGPFYGFNREGKDQQVGVTLTVGVRAWPTTQSRFPDQVTPQVVGNCSVRRTDSYAGAEAVYPIAPKARGTS
jgi:hypothetical protein